MDELSDIFAAAQQGDLGATGALLARFQRMASAYALSLLGDEYLAEDAVQAAQIEACLHIDRVYSVRSFPAWLRRLVFKQCDRIRRRRRPTVPLDEDTIGGRDQGAPATLEHHEQIQTVRRALAALPNAERQVALLHYFQRRSRGDIAAFLELTPGQVAYRLRSARRLFKEQLTAMGQPTNEQLTAAGKAAFREIDDPSPNAELAQSVGLLRQHISLGLQREDGEGQNLLQHSLDTARVAALLAARLGADPAQARRAGLLHDLGKVLDDGSDHPERGARKAAELGEDPAVVDAIARHHERGERIAPDCFLLDVTPLCFALMVADALVSTRWQNAADQSPLEAVVDQLVEFASDGQRAHVYTNGDARALVHTSVDDQSQTAQKLTRSIQQALNFKGRIRFAFAPDQ